MTLKSDDLASFIKIFGTEEIFSFKIVPKLDHTSPLKDAIECCANDGAIGIFPEGASHDLTDILSFKAGMA